MSEPTNGELQIKIDNLMKEMQSGFNGVHQRQDKTNGQVAKNTEHRQHIEGVLAFFKWFGVVQTLAVLGILLKLFL